MFTVFNHSDAPDQQYYQHNEQQCLQEAFKLLCILAEQLLLIIPFGFIGIYIYLTIFRIIG